MNDIGHSSIGFGHWLLLSSPLSGLSSVLEDPLKMSVAMSSVVSLLVFYRFLEANSDIHIPQARSYVQTRGGSCLLVRRRLN